MENNQEIRYAGFFSRLIAFIIDVVILSIPLKAIAYWYGMESVTGKILDLMKKTGA